ncbi:hypothetical protein GY60_15555 [Listeria monocytogenes]|uniref:hypothetical protein n=5 Tax=Listeria monocytogenes TaxID=1639 RepID=UPI00076F5827|nr:hypothetical protein [Listeria monocytogenes]EAD2416526.1 hypothetical protein [Listeria monocytogenes]EAE2103965.1 hypothetical protein [Listeria monocytogenes]PDC51940.1 hypothetical protein A4Q05_02000 [Listeria monocytogenes]RJB48457.1 hypothetical protein D3B88_15065 [Listeria monocytogenes]RJE04674.1 hypothetical protein D3B01_15065 [Listeria monocytogenes]
MKNACKGVFHLFVLGFIFGFLGLGFWVGAEKRGDYYDPPFKCRVPISAKKPHEARRGKGLRRRVFGEFSASFWASSWVLYDFCCIQCVV